MDILVDPMRYAQRRQRCRWDILPKIAQKGK